MNEEIKICVICGREITSDWRTKTCSKKCYRIYDIKSREEYRNSERYKAYMKSYHKKYYKKNKNKWKAYYQKIRDKLKGDKNESSIHKKLL